MLVDERYGDSCVAILKHIQSSQRESNFSSSFIGGGGNVKFDEAVGLVAFAMARSAAFGAAFRFFCDGSSGDLQANLEAMIAQLGHSERRGVLESKENERGRHKDYAFVSAS